MQRAVIRLLLVIVASGLFASCGGAPLNREAEGTASQQVLKGVNQERVKRGLAPVASDGQLSSLAGQHASFLERNVDPTRGKPRASSAHAGFKQRSRNAEKLGYQVVSEVVMIGYAGDLSAVATRTIKGWLNSKSHRGAILNPDRRVMGVETRLPADGRYYVVGILSNGRGR